MQYTYTNKNKVQSKSLGWVSIINTSAAPNQGIHVKNRGNNALLQQAGSMPMKFEAADNDSTFAMGRKNFVKTVNSTSSGMTMNNTDQSSYLARRKALATGKIIQSAPISFRSQDKNTVNSSLRRSRNGGYVVPTNVVSARVQKAASNQSNTYIPMNLMLHNTRSDPWVAYQDGMYDIKSFYRLNHIPQQYIGTDITNVVIEKHNAATHNDNAPKEIATMLTNLRDYKIGNFDSSFSPPTTIYTLQQVQDNSSEYWFVYDNKVYRLPHDNLFAISNNLSGDNSTYFGTDITTTVQANITSPAGSPNTTLENFKTSIRYYQIGVIV